MDLPISKDLVIYLDQNVYGKILNRDDVHNCYFYNLIKKLGDQKNIKIPYSIYHIIESHNRKNPYKTKLDISLIKEISRCNFIDYRNDFDQYTIRERCPFECYNSIIESEEYIDKLASLPSPIEAFQSTRELLKIQGINESNLKNKNNQNINLDIMKPFLDGSNFGFIKEGYEKDLRDILGVKKTNFNSNNIKNIQDLINLINSLFKKIHNEKLNDELYRNQYFKFFGNLDPITFHSLFSIILNSNEVLKNNRLAESLIYISLLKSFGFSSSKGEKIKDREGEFYDICHAVLPCNIFISEDKRIVKLKNILGTKAMNIKEFMDYYDKNNSLEEFNI